MCQTTVHTTGPAYPYPSSPLPLFPSLFVPHTEEARKRWRGEWEENPQQSVQKRRVKEFAVIKQFCTDATLLGWILSPSLPLSLSRVHYGNFSAQVLHFVCANIRDTGPYTPPPPAPLSECNLKFYECLQISWN